MMGAAPRREMICFSLDESLLLEYQQSALLVVVSILLNSQFLTHIRVKFLAQHHIIAATAYKTCSIYFRTDEKNNIYFRFLEASSRS